MRREFSSDNPVSAKAGSSTPAEASITEQLFVRLRYGYGVNLESYRPDVVQLQLRSRVRALGAKSIEDYLELVTRDEREFSRLMDTLIIGSTSFFRDPLAFEALRDLLARVKPVHEELRVWAAGCSTGEEAYSLAIMLQEALQRCRDRRRLRVYATDLRDGALRVARAGQYAQSAIGAVPSHYVNKYFRRESTGGYRVSRRLRNAVIFGHHDLLADPPFSKLDLVSCRNVFLYLNERAQEALLHRFHFALRGEGTLFLGVAESVAAAPALFSASNREHRLYTKRAIARREPRRMGAEGTWASKI